MSELTFAKQFLTSLDARPIKLSSDHVADPRQLPAQSAYILPRNAKPHTKRTAPSSASAAASSNAATQGPSTDITLKTVRPTATTPQILSLPAQPLQNSIFDLKALIARRTGFAADKIKVLWEKRPVSDSKTIQELVGTEAGGGGVEMSVMFVGAPTAAPVSAEADAGEGPPLANADAAAIEAEAGRDTEMKDVANTPVAQGRSGWDVCETEEFWDDLESFVVQRVRDEGVAKKLVGAFRASWKDSQ